MLRSRRPSPFSWQVHAGTLHSPLSPSDRHRTDCHPVRGVYALCLCARYAICAHLCIASQHLKFLIKFHSKVFISACCRFVVLVVRALALTQIIDYIRYYRDLRAMPSSFAQQTHHIANFISFFRSGRKEKKLKRFTKQRAKSFVVCLYYCFASLLGTLTHIHLRVLHVRFHSAVRCTLHRIILVRRTHSFSVFS